MIDNRGNTTRLAWLLAILLAATLLNYANRFAFTQNAALIKQLPGVGEEGYGLISGRFGLGFALGLLVFGILADVVSVRKLYPVVLVAWSLAGIASGTVSDLTGLAWVRFALGFFEAGHWPCALRTTQRLLSPDQRTWGNSVLQSGASLGAVLTPQLVLLLDYFDPGIWRWTFFIVGGLGAPWAIVWWLSIRESDMRKTVIQTDEESADRGEDKPLQEIPLYRIFLTRRWWVLLAVVVCINTLWHYIRVWMPLILEDDHGYSRTFVQNFTSVYYGATFFGSLAAGWLVARLAARGWNVHRARTIVFLAFGLLASLSIAAAFLPAGSLLIGVLLLVAFGSLGLFPVYYSLNQEISARSQGKVGGSLGFSTWLILYFVHPAVGWMVDNFPHIGDVAGEWTVMRTLGLTQLVGPVLDPDVLTRAYLLALVGCGPLIAFAVLALFWGRRPVR